MAAAPSPTEQVSKFHIENNVFVSATEEIDASELQEYLVDLVERGILPTGTVFYMIGGIHHGKKDNKVVEGETEFRLLQG